MENKISIGLIFLVIIGFLFGCASPKKNAHFEFATSSSKPGITIKQDGTLGILAFNSIVPTIGIAVSDVIGTHLLDTPFTILERSYFDQILKERGSPAIEEKNYNQIGKLAGVDYLLVGNVAVRSPRWQRITGATARVIDISNGQVIISATYTPPKRGWAAANYMGESLANAIKKELAKAK